MNATQRCFSAEVLRTGVRTFITSIVIWIKIRLPLFVIMYVFVNNFLSVVLQCHVVRCHSFDVCRTHHWKLRCKPRGRHNQNIQNRSSSRAPQFDWKTDLTNSQCTDVFCCLPARISRVPRLRIQSCSLEVNLAAVQTCLQTKFHRLVYCCHCH